MSYKRIFYKLQCPRCNKEYEVLPAAYKRKIQDTKYGLLCTSCRAKVLWEEKSEEDKQKMKAAASDANKERQKKMSPDELDKEKAARAAGVRKYWENMSDEERSIKSKKRSKDRKDQLAKLSDDDKKEISRKISKSKKDAFANMTDDERNAWIESRRIERNKYWDELDDASKQKVIDLLGENNRNHVANLTDDDRRKMSEIRSDLNREMWDNMSSEDRAARIKSLQDGNAEYVKNMTDEQRDHQKRTNSESSRKYWDNITSSQLAELARKKREAYDGLSIEDRIKRINDSVGKARGENLLHQKFISTFNDSTLSNEYYISAEVVMTNDDEIHSWDYGIYDKIRNTLLMVVDLDGAFYHADSNDYDGIHSKEEYDEKRSLSIPNNSTVKYFIIQELSFKKCFELMMKSLLEDYDEYIDNIFKNCRSMPFPEPRYSDSELLKSYDKLVRTDCSDKYHKDLSLNTRLGDRLINHFHHSIWHAKRAGSISPYDAWYNDDLLRKCIENRVIYQSYLNPNKVLQGFNVSRIAQKVSVFSAGRAKMIIHKYLSEYNEIFDPFSGFSGRMLGAMSLDKRYIGQDISKIHVRESNDMINFLKTNGRLICANISVADILDSYGTYECLFTCPPYSDKEEWQDVPVSKTTCDEWVEICLDHFKCKRYVFVVDNTEKYKDHITDEIINKSHFGTNREYILIFNSDERAE